MLLRTCVFLALALAASSMAFGQVPPAAGDSVATAISSLPRFEAGWQTAQIRTNCVGTTDQTCEIPSLALGISGTWNLKHFLAINANYVVTPSAGNGSTDNNTKFSDPSP